MIGMPHEPHNSGEHDRAKVSRKLEQHALAIFDAVPKSDISIIAGLECCWNPRTFCLTITSDRVRVLARYREVWFRRDGRKWPAGEVSFWPLSEDASSLFCAVFGASGHTSIPGQANVPGLHCSAPELADHISARLLFEMEGLLMTKVSSLEQVGSCLRQDQRPRIGEPTPNRANDRSLAKIGVT